MKKYLIKATFGLSFVAVTVVSGMKAYNAKYQSGVDLILAENVEALSKDESGANVLMVAETSDGAGTRF